MGYFCSYVRWMFDRARSWVRHTRLNPIPCTCYDCEMKKPLPEWAILIINQKLADGTIPRRKVKRRPPEDSC